MKRINKAFLASLLFGASTLSFAHSDDRAGWGHHMEGGWGMGMMMIMVIITGLAIYGYIQWSKPSKPPVPQEKTALQMLEEAYAKGEIDREAFLQKRDDLTESQSD